jgi:ABC-type transport system involved in cytochrome c biogenesis ATPase subunit
LAWAICDVINAPLILLDEPSKGMSGQSLKLLKTWLLDKSNEGRIILMAEHGDALLDLPVRLIRLGDQA